VHKANLAFKCVGANVYQDEFLKVCHCYGSYGHLLLVCLECKAISQSVPINNLDMPSLLIEFPQPAKFDFDAHENTFQLHFTFLFYFHNIDGDH
jgi:hypothetical protein